MEALRQKRGLALDDPEETGCKHEKCCPEFNSEEAKNLDSYEVRKKYPRFMGACPDCGSQVIYYASAEHYIMGDW